MLKADDGGHGEKGIFGRTLRLGSKQSAYRTLDSRLIDAESAASQADSDDESAASQEASDAESADSQEASDAESAANQAASDAK